MTAQKHGDLQKGHNEEKHLFIFVAAGWSVKMLQRIYLTGSRNALSHHA
jgi:hypothetical protein